MNLYLITQDTVDGYDTYDSAVVVAESYDAAKAIHPSEYLDALDPDDPCHTWAADPTQVTAELIGKAAPHLKAGTVIVSSFNAG